MRTNRVLHRNSPAGCKWPNVRSDRFGTVPIEFYTGILKKRVWQQKVFGPQPAGSLAVSNLDAPLCAGHEAAGGTLLVMCEFPDGVQGSHHPRPGVRYSGVTRRGFYPDDAVGRRCVRLLWAAFSRGQLFRIGDSLSTGIADTVVYGLHQKSRPSGGATQHGWPDTGYLERLQSECALVGIFLPPV